MIKKLCLRANTEDAHKVAVDTAAQSGLHMFYKSDTSIEGQSRTANVEELISSIKVFIEERNSEMLEEMQAEGQISEGAELTEADMPVVTLSDYLENVSLLSAVDIDEEDNNKIALMTVHSSKGLEFPYVYVVGLEENIFPSGGFLASESEIEEERRLFYVAMTRAKTVLQLSFASTRTRNGKHESNSPSRFVKEIDSRFIENPLSSDPVRTERSTVFQRRPEPPRAPVPVRRPQVIQKRVADEDFVPTPVLQLKVGQRIEHNRFGFGRILEITGEVTDLKAKIAFDDHGEKILLLKYAKIRAI